MNAANVPGAKRWAVLVGVERYADATLSDWPAAAANVAALHAQLAGQPAGGYGPDRVQTLGLPASPSDTAATRLHILRALAAAGDRAGADDLLLFYFAGRVRVVDGQTFLLPADAMNSALLPDTALPFQRVKDLLRRSASRASVVILDVCDAGTPQEAEAAPQSSLLFFESVFAGQPETALLAAFSDSERCDPRDGVCSPFTRQLLAAFEGAFDGALGHPPALSAVADDVSRLVADEAPVFPVTVRYSEPAGQVIFPLAAPVVSLPASAQTGQPVGAAQVQNPIGNKFPMAVRQKEEFFGRAEELERVRRILRTPVNKPIVVQGERCIGKTSFLNRAKVLLEEWEDQPFLHFSIEPSSVRSCEDFARELWFGLSRSIRAARPDRAADPDIPFQFSTFAGFVDRLNTLREPLPDKRFVVFIDELDKIIRQCQTLEYVSILGLILYIVEQTRFPLLFFVSIVQDFPDDPGSPFTSSADFFVLHTFDWADTQALVLGLLGDHVDIAPECVAWIFEYTGGHPYFIKLLLTKVFELSVIETGSRAITLDMLETVAQSAVHSRSADDLVRNIYSVYLDDDQRYVLLWLACRDGVLQPDDITGTTVTVRTAMRELARRDYVTSPDGTPCRLRIQFFRDWLRHWSRFELEVERLCIPCAQAATPVQIAPTGICIDLTTQVVYVDGAEIAEPLTDMQYRALLYLAAHSGRIVAKTEFASHVWDTDYYTGDDQRISTLVYRLREKLDDTQNSRQYIKTVRGIGFRVQDVTLIRSTPFK